MAGTVVALLGVGIGDDTDFASIKTTRSFLAVPFSFVFTVRTSNSIFLVHPTCSQGGKSMFWAACVPATI